MSSSSSPPAPAPHTKPLACHHHHHHSSAQQQQQQQQEEQQLHYSDYTHSYPQHHQKQYHYQQQQQQQQQQCTTANASAVSTTTPDDQASNEDSDTDEDGMSVPHAFVESYGIDTTNVPSCISTLLAFVLDMDFFHQHLLATGWLEGEDMATLEAILFPANSATATPSDCGAHGCCDASPSSSPSSPTAAVAQANQQHAAQLQSINCMVPLFLVLQRLAQREQQQQQQQQQHMEMEMGMDEEADEAAHSDVDSSSAALTPTLTPIPTPSAPPQLSSSSPACEDGLLQPVWDLLVRFNAQRGVDITCNDNNSSNNNSSSNSSSNTSSDGCGASAATHPSMQEVLARLHLAVCERLLHCGSYEALLSLFGLLFPSFPLLIRGAVPDAWAKRGVPVFAIPADMHLQPWTFSPALGSQAQLLAAAGLTANLWPIECLASDQQ